MMKIAVLIPCYNEEPTIEKVIKDFRKELPSADIYVYDNNSSDKTSEIALKNGAIVKKEVRQGKGNVVRSMFRDIDADVYIMTDGDDTYPAEEVQKLIKPIIEDDADMVIGDRLSNGTYSKENKRMFHGIGNKLVKFLVNFLYKSDIKDIMTGYRAFSRRFVKTMPVLSKRFEIETEMSLHSLNNNLNLVEVPIVYRDRPEGSVSKLNTFTDGIKVIRMLFKNLKDYNPFKIYFTAAMICFIISLAVGLPVVFDFYKTGFVDKFPTALLATGIMLIAAIFFVCAVVLDTIANIQKRNYEVQVNAIDEVYKNRCECDKK